MKKRDIAYYVGYSARLERMHATLYSRIDRLSSGLQFAAALTIFADIANTKTGLAVVAVLSLYSFVQQPGRLSANAATQAKRYEHLSVLVGSMAVDEAKTQFAEIQKDDSSAIGALCRVAEHGEWLRVGATPDFPLSLREKSIAWIAGDLPQPITQSETV